jgi:hypothetical protein
MATFRNRSGKLQARAQIKGLAMLRKARFILSILGAALSALVKNLNCAYAKQ